MVACGQGRREPAPAVARDASGARTARALDDARLAALAAVTVAGTRVEVVRRDRDGLDAVVTAADATRATMTIGRCVGCAPIAVAAWERERPAFTALYAPAAGDRLALDLRAESPWATIELVARRTIEGVADVIVQRHWNDGVLQLAVSCERPGDDAAERACTALVAATTNAYLPVLAPSVP